MGHTTYPPRHHLPPEVAQGLAHAHQQTGMSYRQVARAISIDWGYWRRLTRGERCPSRQVAQRIISTLHLPDDVAQELLEASVDRTAWYGE